MTTATATAEQLATVPDIAKNQNLHLDRLREFLRSRPDLRALGQQIGGLTVYSAAAVERIVTEFEERRKSAAK